ncbi:MAG: hypothetical protein Q9M28_05300 [Mariprofundaceae bacterium]|nr:hypothetical protein [Mariprofundaceae bacterium]
MKTQSISAPLFIHDPYPYFKAHILAKYTKAEELKGDLPEVAELLSLEKAIQLGMSMGFGDFYLRRWTDDKSQWSDPMHMIVEVLGLYDARKVINHFSGCQISFAGCYSVMLKARDQDIINSTDSVQNIAVRYGLHRNRIMRIRNRKNNK